MDREEFCEELRKALNEKYPCTEEVVDAFVDTIHERRLNFYMQCGLERALDDPFIACTMTPPEKECRAWKRMTDGVLRDTYGASHRREIFYFLSSMTWMEMRVIRLRFQTQPNMLRERFESFCENKYSLYCLSSENARLTKYASI